MRKQQIIIIINFFVIVIINANVNVKVIKVIKVINVIVNVVMFKNTSLGSARLIVISGWGDTARSLRTGHHHQDDDHDVHDGHDNYA